MTKVALAFENCGSGTRGGCIGAIGAGRGCIGAIGAGRGCTCEIGGTIGTKSIVKRNLYG